MASIIEEISENNFLFSETEEVSNVDFYFDEKDLKKLFFLFLFYTLLTILLVPYTLSTIRSLLNRDYVFRDRLIRNLQENYYSSKKRKEE